MLIVRKSLLFQVNLAGSDLTHYLTLKWPGNVLRSFHRILSLAKDDFSTTSKWAQSGISGRFLEMSVVGS